MSEPVKFKRKKEEQLIPRKNMNAVGDQIGELEAYKKALNNQSNDIRKALLPSMLKYGIDTWTTPNGTQITIKYRNDKEVEEFDFEAFAKDHPKLVAKYTRPTLKVGKETHLVITPPKQ